MSNYTFRVFLNVEYSRLQCVNIESCYLSVEYQLRTSQL